MTLNDLLLNDKTRKYIEDSITTTYKKFKLFIIIDKEDFEQQCYLNIHKWIPNFNPEKSALKTHITRMLMSTAGKCIEKARGCSQEYDKLEIENNTIRMDSCYPNEMGLNEPFGNFIKDEDCNTEEKVTDNILIQSILKSDRLTDKQKRILELMLEGKKVIEIADILNCSQSNISIHFSKAKKKILMDFAL